MVLPDFQTIGLYRSPSPQHVKHAAFSYQDRGVRSNETTVYAQVIFSLVRNQQTVHLNSSALNLLWFENKPLEVTFLSLYSYSLTDGRK